MHQGGELAVVVAPGVPARQRPVFCCGQGARVRLLESNPQALDEAQAAALRAEGIELVLGEQGPELFAGCEDGGAQPRPARGAPGAR